MNTQKPPQKTSKQAAKERLAQALRHNLKRRKAGPSGSKTQKKADTGAQ